MTVAPSLHMPLLSDDQYTGVQAPVIVLGPPRSFTSVVGAMIGRHPQLYGMPELALWHAETVGQWWALCARASFPMADGLLRAVAEIVFGEQSEHTVELARGWLRRRQTFTVGLLVEELGLRVAPRIIVEKSPGTVYQQRSMQNVLAQFPAARFVHLTRHPYGHGASVMQYLVEYEQMQWRAPNWLTELAESPAFGDLPAPPSGFDPQCGWHRLHSGIVEFLTTVAPARQLRVRGEDVLREPDRMLTEIAAWLGLSTDDEAIEAMKHPEQSPYARFGPRNAVYGNDLRFLRDPVLRPARAETDDLAGPLPWRGDDRGLAASVRQLAESFGYA